VPAERLTRDHIPVDQTWNLGDIFASPRHWREGVAQIQDDIRTVAAFKGRLGDGASVLLACLEAHETLMARLDRIRMYAYFSLSADGSLPENQAMAEQSEALIADVDAARSFLKSEITALPDGTVERYLSEEPKCAIFHALLDEILLTRGHRLLPETEEVLAGLGEVLKAPNTIWQLATAVDMTCDPAHDADGTAVPVSIAAYSSAHSRSTDRTLRRSAYESLTSGLNRHKATLATTLTTHIKQNVVLARARGYGSATEMVLAHQQVPNAVYQNVLDVIHDEIAPHTRRLVRLRARALGLDKLHRYDLDAPIDPEYAPSISFEESGQQIRETLRPFGEEYGTIIADAFNKRWIDRADNVGKRSGAFSWGVYGVHPYAFVTWRDTYRNAFTLAHELGHTGHYELSMRSQPRSTISQDAFTVMVEAPSTANELLLGQHLLNNTTDPQHRRWLLMQLAETFTGNMGRSLLAARFERRIYELAEAGKPLNAATLMEVQGDVLERFYGDTVEIDDGARLGWAQMPHFYMSVFLYSYSAGLASGYAVVKAMREEGRPAVDRWVHMLRQGNSKPPTTLLQEAGADLTNPETLRQAVRYFGTLVDELEQETPA
jgi:oligoendopeptidase F